MPFNYFAIVEKYNRILSGDYKGEEGGRREREGRKNNRVIIGRDGVFLRML